MQRNTKRAIKVKESEKLGTVIYKKIIGGLMKKGKETGLKSTIHLALKRISLLKRKPIYRIIYTIFTRLKIYFEIRIVRFRKIKNVLIFPISTERRLSKIVHWFNVLIDKFVFFDKQKGNPMLAKFYNKWSREKGKSVPIPKAFRKSFFIRFVREFLRLLRPINSKKKSLLFEMVKINNKQVFSNRAKLHYRW